MFVLVSRWLSLILGFSISLAFQIDLLAFDSMSIQFHNHKRDKYFPVIIKKNLPQDSVLIQPIGTL